MLVSHAVMVERVETVGSRWTRSMVALLLCATWSHRAEAFGGLWSSGAAPVRNAGEEIVFVDNPDTTITAIVRLSYEGPPQKFAWVIPVPGKPKIGVSSSTVFRRLEAATAPEYLVEVAVRGACKPGTVPALSSGAGYETAAESAAEDSIVKIDQGSIGPYDYTSIKVDPSIEDPAKAATDWFTANGYTLTGMESSVLGPYLKDGLNLLAFKLGRGVDTGAIKPVMLTYESKLPMIPLRPASVAAPRDIGIQVWVFGPSQAVPLNYGSLVLDEALIDWLSGARHAAGTLPAGGAGPFGPTIIKPSNYDAVVTAAVREAGHRGFVTELAAPASQFRGSVWSSVDEQALPMMSRQHYADGIDAILAANRHFGGWDGWRDAVRGASTLPARVTLDDFARDPARYRGVVSVDAERFFSLLQAKVIEPVSDAAALFHAAPYLTRLYSRMSASEMTVDPVFTYNEELAQLSNTRVARQVVQCSSRLDQREAPWRITLPHGAVIAGKGDGTWPLPVNSMPANLELVQLSATGSGVVVKDNREAIAAKLAGSTGPSAIEAEAPHPPLTGVMIGGAQNVTPRTVPATQTSPKPSTGHRCTVSRVGSGAGSMLALGLSLAGALFSARRLARSRGGARAA